MKVKERLSKRAVMKEDRDVSSIEKQNTKRNLVRVTTKCKSRTQTVSNGGIKVFEECPNAGDLIK